jgi:hypothetical protein
MARVSSAICGVMPRGFHVRDDRNKWGCHGSFRVGNRFDALTFAPGIAGTGQTSFTICGATLSDSR